MSNSTNPLLCDPETGVCEIPVTYKTGNEKKVLPDVKPIRIIYFTDPICSSCWGIEPQLRKLKLTYHNVLEIDYHMGGLLPDWSYNSGGISKPSDVASHWDEVSKHYNMPIDGDVWLEDPLPSSYPPSVAFKAAQMQNKIKAIAFLRILREMVFLEKKNITKWEYIAQAAANVALDVATLKHDYEQDANVLFQADLALAKQMSVRGFPSVFLIDCFGNQEFVYGVKPYEVYEQAIQKLYPQAEPTNYNKRWDALFDVYPTLTTKEFAELSDWSISESESLLEALNAQQKLKKLVTKNGILWLKK